MTATLPRPAGLASLPGVVLLTDWTPADAAALSRSARAGAEWLVPVRIDGGLVLIGPALGPVITVCGPGSRVSSTVRGPVNRRCQPRASSWAIAVSKVAGSQTRSAPSRSG